LISKIFRKKAKPGAAGKPIAHTSLALCRTNKDGIQNIYDVSGNLYRKFQAPSSKAPNYNTQITNKFQIQYPMFKTFDPPQTV
jgi:hypothetical protein